MTDSNSALASEGGDKPVLVPDNRRGAEASPNSFWRSFAGTLIGALIGVGGAAVGAYLSNQGNMKVKNAEIQAAKDDRQRQLRTDGYIDFAAAASDLSGTRFEAVLCGLRLGSVATGANPTETAQSVGEVASALADHCGQATDRARQLLHEKFEILYVYASRDTIKVADKIMTSSRAADPKRHPEGVDWEALKNARQEFRIRLCHELPPEPRDNCG